MVHGVNNNEGQRVYYVKLIITKSIAFDWILKEHFSDILSAKFNNHVI